jgi:glutathione S-transferase
MITIHHLTRSRSERIVWLAEELGLPYKLEVLPREATGAAPAAMKALHAIGRAPIIHDGDTVLAESGAIVEYLVRRHGGGRLAPAIEEADYPRYLYWMHFVEGSLMTVMLTALTVSRIPEATQSPVKARVDQRVLQFLGFVDGELAGRDYLASQSFTAADVMMEFPFGTLQHFMPCDLGPYPNIASWLQRIRSRPAYLRAMALAGPDAAPATDA